MKAGVTFENVEKPFIRHNFEFEVVELNKYRTRESFDSVWNHVEVRPVSGVENEDIGEDDHAPIPWFKNSVTWTKYTTPADAKRQHKPVQRFHTLPGRPPPTKEPDSSLSEMSSEFSEPSSD